MKHVGLYQSQYKTQSYKPLIYLFKRGLDGKKTVDKITDFKSYLYIKTELLKEGVPAEVIKVEDGFKSVFNEDVSKCYVRTPSAIYKLKEYYSARNHSKDIYEADITYDSRYMIDEVEENQPSNYKVLTFDIETDCSEGFPDHTNPVESIICISMHDNYTNKIKTFVWREDLDIEVKGNIHYYNNEIDMLNAFLDEWRSTDADIITAWNLGFDIGYLIARLNRLNIPYNKLSSVTDTGLFRGPVWKRPKGEVEILGLVLFDALQAYKKMHFGELSSYSLNNIAAEELNDEKTEGCANTGHAWRNDIDLLIEYNIKDVDLVVKIVDKTKLISIFEDIKNFSGVRNLNDCFLASRIHETRIMKKYKDEYVFPNKAAFQEKSADTMIKGAFVREPEAGLHKDVVVFDFKSLYPSLIYTFNLSTEMVVEEGGTDILGLRFRTDKKGIMPSMIKELMQLKDDMKIKVAGTGQEISDKMFAIKTFINSFYGINALPSFRLYNKEVAERITGLGQYFIKELNSYVDNETEHSVVYNDTDSLFVKMNIDANIIEESEKLLELLNKKVTEMLNKFNVQDANMKLEMEKIFKHIILQTKKRYAGHITWEDGETVDKIKIAGMAARRSDTSAISKTLQKKLLDIILKGKGKEQAIAYVKEVIQDIIAGKIPVKQIAIPVKLNHNIEDYKVQNTPKLRGVRWSNSNIGTQFKNGQKFLMVYADNLLGSDVVCFEEEAQISNIKINTTTMLDKVVLQKIRKIFEAIEWDNEYKQLELLIMNKTKGQKSLTDKWN